MNNISLNIKLIEQEMRRAGLTRPMLCKKLNISRQLAWYIFEKKPVSYASMFSRLFKRPARDFIL